MVSPVEATRVIRALRAFWPERPFTDEAAGLFAKGMADLPYDLAIRAVEELSLTERSCPSLAQIRGRCAEIGAGIVPADEAWDEAMRVLRSRKVGDRSPLAFSNAALDQAVASVGAERMLRDENPSALRAQFRDVYRSYAERLVARTAMPDLIALAEGRRAPALPEATTPAPDPPPERYVSLATIRARERFAARDPAKGALGTGGMRPLGSLIRAAPPSSPVPSGDTLDKGR